MTAPLDPNQAAAVARGIAFIAHDGQADKGGEPYIGHPARIAARLPGSASARAVAWLHDVVEDTRVTLDDLEGFCFPWEVIQAVDAITRREDEAPEDYYKRVGANPLALRVKLADIDDNTDPGRLAKLDDATRERLERKYAKARAALSGAIIKHLGPAAS